MTTVEDRLTAALAARADQLQVEDLRPPELPNRSKSWVRRPATYLAAAAACAAAVAAPFVIAGDDDAPPEHGPATQPADPESPSSAGEGGDWPVVRTERVDVDGDGIEDEVNVRDPRRGVVGQIRVDVVLSSGGSAWIQLREPDIGLRFTPADIDSNGDGELVLADYIGRPSMHVFDLVDGSLVPVDQPDDPPLTSAYTREGRVQHWWLDDGRLYSSRSVEILAESDHYVPLPTEYAVHAWSWLLHDGALVPKDMGTLCVRDGAPERLLPCAGD